MKERRQDGKKIEKKNTIKKDILNMSIDTMGGAGYYNLKNVRTNNNTFLDIFMLIEEPMDRKQFEKLEAWHKLS